MKKKGEGGLAIVTAIFIFIVGMSAINLFKDDITLSRTINGINCVDSSAISDGFKLTCLGFDLIIPISIILVISVSTGLIVNKFIKGKK